MTVSPAPWTAKEFFALPVGPGCGAVALAPTAADRARGYLEWRGRRIVVKDNTLTVSIHVPQPWIPCYADDNRTPLGFRDAAGVFWQLGHYVDGALFRHRSAA